MLPEVTDFNHESESICLRNAFMRIIKSQSTDVALHLYFGLTYNFFSIILC